ncbi:MAG TPA: GAF domain-containing sensor histidine kinase [Acidimicrobiia bacterium]
MASASTFDARLQQLLDAMLGISSEQSLPSVLHGIIESTCKLVEARYGALGVLGDDGRLSELVTVGVDEATEEAIGRLPEFHGVLGKLTTDPKPLRMRDIRTHPEAQGFPENHPTMRSFLGVPVRGLDAVGNLYVAEKVGADEFTDEDEQLAVAFAAAASVAVDNSRLRDRLGNIALLEERERIARDLHDKVIQRLFAAGMALQTALPLTTRTEVATRISRAIEDLDETIREIRYTIFALARPTRRGLRVDIFAQADGAREALGFSPELKLDGPIDTVVTEDKADHLLATLQEALSNVAKHARASTVDVRVQAGPDLLLRVEDDGVGLPDRLDRTGGLDNMQQRAEGLGGGFTARKATHGGGTVVEWRVPLV